MKKVTIAIAAIMFLISCGGSNEQVTITDSIITPGDDSSVILPPLTDSAKADSIGVGGKGDLKPVE